MKAIAATLAAAGFFVLAFVGWLSDVPVFVCGLRALAGAGVLYVLIRVAGTAIIRILVEAAVKAKAGEGEPEAERDRHRER